MGKRVGDLEFVVDADTKKLKATLVRAGGAAGRAGGEAAQTEFDKQLNDVGGVKFSARLKEIREKAELAFKNLDIDLGVDDARAQADLKKLAEQVRELDLAVDVGADTDEAKQEIRFLREYIEATRLQLQVDIDEDMAKAEAAQIKAELDAILGKLRVEANIVDLEEELARSRARLFAEEQQLLIDAEIDEDRWQAQQNKIRADNERFARESGQEFSDGFSSGLDSRLGKIVAAVAAITQPALVGLEGLASAAVAVVGQAVLAAGTSILALSAQVTGLVNVLAGGVTGFKGFGTALGVVNEEFAAARDEFRLYDADSRKLRLALRELSPQAQDAALAFAGLRQ